MSDAYLEFLSENKERRFPFVEDCSLKTDLDVQFPDDVILDVRGFHRERPEIPPQLSTFVGPDNAGGLPGYYHLTFKMGRIAAPLTFQLLVPIDNPIWPLTYTIVTPDPIYPESRLSSLRLTIGAGILSVDPAADYTFPGTALLEPITISELYRTQVDQVKVVHADADSEFVGGDLVLRGGYNMDLQQSGQTIRLNPSLGGGELGRWTGSLNPENASKCKGALLSLNGQGATERGEFFFYGRNGIDIIPLPTEHKIQIKISPEMLGTICTPDPNDLTILVTDEGETRGTDDGATIVLNP